MGSKDFFKNYFSEIIFSDVSLTAGKNKFSYETIKTSPCQGTATLNCTLFYVNRGDRLLILPF
jgi:hypothetical protein